MALKIRKANDPVKVDALVILIYGQPGAGKTSTACTASNALVFDFDRGSHRSAFRSDAVVIDAWQDIANVTAEDLEGYDTIILDTVGRALDFITAAMPDSEGRTRLKTASGQPTIQGYGWIKAAFTSWLKRMTTLRKDVVLIAHDKEDKDGDTRIVRPDVMGGSYAEIMKVVDFAGYLYLDGNRARVLDFNPSDRWIGKNAAGMDAMVIPDFSQETNWFAGVIDKMKAAISGQTERHRAILKIIENVRDVAGRAQSADDLNDIIDFLREQEKPVKVQGWKIVSDAAKRLGIEYDKNAKAFIESDEPETEPDDAKETADEAA